MKFPAFVLTTLLIELIVSRWYSAEFASESALVSFYAILATWSIWRANFALRSFRMNTGPLVFVATMLISAFSCFILTLLTFATIVAIRQQFIPELLVNAYYFGYNVFPYVAAGLTIIELLSIFMDRVLGENSAMGRCIARALGAVYSMAGHNSYARALEASR